MKELLEDYKRRLSTICATIENNWSNLPDDFIVERLRIKAGCYRTIISELEHIINKPLDDNKCETVVDVINIIPQQPQVQYDLARQLLELRMAANKLGLYDAADFIKKDIYNK